MKFINFIFKKKTQFIEQIKISDLSIKQLKELNDSFKIQINELTAKNDDFKKTSMEYTEKIEKYQKELQIDHEVFSKDTI